MTTNEPFFTYKSTFCKPSTDERDLGSNGIGTSRKDFSFMDGSKYSKDLPNQEAFFCSSLDYFS